MKQLPPKPTEASRKWGPILLSVPIAFDSSLIEAPDFSQSADKLFIEDILWANIAFDANFDNSEDQTLVVNIFSFGIQLIYISTTTNTDSISTNNTKPYSELTSDPNNDADSTNNVDDRGYWMLIDNNFNSNN